VSQTPDPTPSRDFRAMDELWRRALGRRLRELRLARGERLVDTAVRAGISSQYLSEIERGRKDASSEMLAAVIGALDSSLADVLVLVVSGLQTGTAEVLDFRSTTSLARPAITDGASLLMAA
jgi:transcriptional regulator with XRE-family HTH domain